MTFRHRFHVFRMAATVWCLLPSRHTFSLGHPVCERFVWPQRAKSAVHNVLLSFADAMPIWYGYGMFAASGFLAMMCAISAVTWVVCCFLSEFSVSSVVYLLVENSSICDKFVWKITFSWRACVCVWEFVCLCRTYGKRGHVCLMKYEIFKLDTSASSTMTINPFQTLSSAARHSGGRCRRGDGLAGIEIDGLQCGTSDRERRFFPVKMIAGRNACSGSTVLHTMNGCMCCVRRRRKLA